MRDSQAAASQIGYAGLRLKVHAGEEAGAHDQALVGGSRERVVAAVDGGLSRRKAAERFG